MVHATYTPKVQHVCDELYGKEADYVDWKHFLVCAAQPWHLPHSYQLLATLERFQESVGKDQQASRQQFMAVQTWMDEEEGREEGERKGGFNRTEKLKQFLYELFSNKDKKVDYTNMVRGSVIYTMLRMCLCGVVAVHVCGRQC